VAIGVFGERGVERAVPRLVPHLSHEYPLVRFFAKHAIESITGESLPIDPNRPASEIESQVVGWRNERSLGGTIIPIP
jgi:hypothetical protein